MAKSKGLCMVKVDPPIAQEKEWNEWYNKRVEDLLAIPGFLSGRRFTKIEGIPKEIAVPGAPKYLALYDVTDVSILKDRPYRDWGAKQSAQPPHTFEKGVFELPGFACGVYEQIYPEEGEYKPPPSKFVWVLGHEVPRNKDKEFNVWYNTEHLPAITVVPGVLTARRFVMAERKISPVLGSGGSLSKYLTVYDVESQEVVESETLRKAIETPWTAWVRSWYTRKMCTLYYRIYPAV